MKESLISFLNSFDNTDDQGWCDIGYELSEKISRSYDRADWENFISSVGELKEGVFLGVVEILPLIPEDLPLKLLNLLLIHAKHEAWLEAFSIVSSLYFTENQKVLSVIDFSVVKKKFESEFVSWVNFPYNLDSGFMSYYNKYKHLIDENSRKLYESIAKVT
jgi:hypothetical protein